MSLTELELEKKLGGQGSVQQREIPVVDLSDFDSRRLEIGDALWDAATSVGFFQLSNHGISMSEIDRVFQISEAFFALPDEVKKKFSLLKGQNAGWEFMSQVRPSTGTTDQKESFQVTLPKMGSLWPDQVTLPEFQRLILNFEYKAWQLSCKVMSLFAERLGFELDFFTKAHDRASPEYQSTLRLIHYLAVDEKTASDPTIWRAGAHTDFDCLTLVFQREGQDGLQACPGNDAQSRAWTDVPARNDLICCNIGDMLMRWSGDKLKSTLHRVKMPPYPDAARPRLSTIFFLQANKDQLISGSGYEPIRAGDYITRRIAANYELLKEKSGTA